MDEKLESENKAPGQAQPDRGKKQPDPKVARFNSLRDKIGPDPHRHVMKRCFMTGKQCIFSSDTSGKSSQLEPKDLSVFVITPFKTNFDAFDEWSLFPYLQHEYGLKKENTRRADHVRSTGYIVCEKICHALQQTDLVIADITFPSPNVFYELGLAYGLERPIVFMVNAADKASDDGVLENRSLRSCLAVEQEKVFFYPGVAPMVPSPTIYALEEKVQSPWKARTPKARSTVRDLKISVLKTHEKTRERPGEASGQRPPQKDLTIDVYGLLEGAVAVAMSEIVRAVEEKQSKIARAAEENQAAPPPLEPWEQVLIALGKRRDRLKQANMVPVGEATTFEGVASELERSFCTIIDVSDDDAVGCFWLGYCHARGLDAIPFDRTSAAASDGTAAPPTGGTNESERPLKRLAFDIRALWYMEHNDRNAVALKAEIRDILTRLLERDLPDRQRRAFWDRFPRETDLKILTGAIHVEELNREMVGDWDVRTVSELVSHLTQVREPSSIKLATPLYSPQHAVTKGKLAGDEFLAKFYGGIASELDGCSAVVIASADVNPVTEYLLHKVYGLGEPMLAKDPKAPKLCGYVAVKRLRGDVPPEKDKLSSRRFYTETQKPDQEPKRGFQPYENGYEKAPELRPYRSQDDDNPEPFDLLGHLLIAKWPLPTRAKTDDHPEEEPSEGQLIVLLNGVSGPATSALAEILTGGGPKAKPEMMAKAEQMLGELNRTLDDPKWDVVEAIIEVKVGPPQGASGNPFRDSREVYSWRYAVPPRTFLRSPVPESEPK